MLAIYQALAILALREFSDVVSRTSFVGGTDASPNKLRLTLRDESFLEIWLSSDGDYAYHWEQRRQRGRLFRWDNAPIIHTSVLFPITSTLATRPQFEKAISLQILSPP